MSDTSATNASTNTKKTSGTTPVEAADSEAAKDVIRKSIDANMLNGDASNNGPNVIEVPSIKIFGDKLDDRGFIQQDDPIPDGFAPISPAYLIYDPVHAAPLGVLQGQLRRIEEYVIGGSTHSYLIVKPTRPCAAVMETSQGTFLARADGSAFVAVPLMEPPQNLRALLTATHWIEIQVRLTAQGVWKIYFNKNKMGKGE